MDQIKIIRKNLNIVFEDKDKYEELFAKEFARNGHKVKEAWDVAFYQVNKIRASQLLSQPAIWQTIFNEILSKKTHSQKELHWLSEYNRIMDIYEFSPFELYTLYVEINTSTSRPISASISNDPVKDIITLINLHHFFTIISREKFLCDIKMRIKEEYEAIQSLPNYLSDLKKQCDYLKKKQDIETDEIIESCLHFKKGKHSPNQLKMKFE